MSEDDKDSEIYTTEAKKFVLYVENMGGTEETWKGVCKLLASINPLEESFQIYEKDPEPVEGEPTKFGRLVASSEKVRA
jgi:hypothetical protein